MRKIRKRSDPFPLHMNIYVVKRFSLFSFKIQITMIFDKKIYKIKYTQWQGELITSFYALWILICRFTWAFKCMRKMQNSYMLRQASTYAQIHFTTYNMHVIHLQFLKTHIVLINSYRIDALIHKIYYFVNI